MIALRNILFKSSPVISRQMACFSDKWRQRDEASQKVYISKSEKQTMKKLLKKIEIQERDLESNLQEFDRKLKDIMRRYKIQNDAMASQIGNLHKSLTH